MAKGRPEFSVPTKTLNVYLPVDLHDYVSKWASRGGVWLSWAVREALYCFFEGDLKRPAEHQ